MEFGYVLHPVRRKHATTAIVGPRTRAERLLFYGPMVTTAALGLLVMGSRFILVLRDNLKETPDVAAVMFLAVLVGGVSIAIVLACALLGAVIGYILTACFGRGLPTGGTASRTPPRP